MTVKVITGKKNPVKASTDEVLETNQKGGGKSSANGFAIKTAVWLFSTMDSKLIIFGPI